VSHVPSMLAVAIGMIGAMPASAISDLYCTERHREGRSDVVMHRTIWMLGSDRYCFDECTGIEKIQAKDERIIVFKYNNDPPCYNRLGMTVDFCTEKHVSVYDRIKNLYFERTSSYARGVRRPMTMRASCEPKRQSAWSHVLHAKHG
jgi:hypothetical protein